MGVGYVEVFVPKEIEVVCKDCGLPLDARYDAAKSRMVVVTCSNCISAIVEQNEDISIKAIKEQMRQAVDNVLG